MILGMDECAIRDTNNVVSSDEFYECIAIVVCQMGDNIFAHAAQIAGHYKGDAAGIWDRSRGAGPPPGHIYEIKSVSRSIEFPMVLRGQWLIMALQIIVEWQSYIICSTWGDS